MELRADSQFLERFPLHALPRVLAVIDMPARQQPQRQMRDGCEFGNTRTAWLAALRDTAHWAGIELFAREVITASEEHDLPVDDGS
jgi:hypothetical protein